MDFLTGVQWPQKWWYGNSEYDTLGPADSPCLFLKDQSLAPYCPLIRERNNMWSSLGGLTQTQSGKCHMKQVNKELADSKMASPFFSSGKCGSVMLVFLTKSYIHRGWLSFIRPYSKELTSSPKMLLLNFCLFLKKVGPFSGHTHSDFCLGGHWKRSGRWLERFQLVSNIKIEITFLSHQIFKK